jgi:hypothetical protein
MVFAADYPFLNILWSMVIFFAFVIWVWLLVTVFTDLFRRHDISGWGKAGWTLFLIVLPFLGVFTYLIAHSEGMAERSAKHASETKAQFDDYVRDVARSDGPTAEIDQAKRLLDSGAINQAEYDRLKEKALAAT